jgi:hypothetical protein
MKTALLISGLLFSSACFCQEQANVGDLLRPYKKVTAGKIPQDSLRLPAPGYVNKIPNAFKGTLPEPVFSGSNGKGYNIYILQLDNMPVLRPDSTFQSNMFTGMYRRKNTR